MAARGGGKGEDLPNKLELLRVLRDGREAVLAAKARVRPYGTTYHALCMVTSSIDALAHFLTSNPIFYLDPMHSTPGPPLHQPVTPDPTRSD